MDANDLTAEFLKNVLDYDPETGFFVWKQRFGKRGVPGKRAGTVDFNGYVVITINKKRHKAHRLAWLWMHGAWPEIAIDHINGERTDNRISNLREANWSENQHNRRLQRNNKSGYPGVSWDRHACKWRAGIRVNALSQNLGGYDTKEEAYAAHLKAKALEHPFQPVPRHA